MTIIGAKESREKIQYNSMAKTYLDGSKQILCATKRVFRQSGWESRKISCGKLEDLVAEAEETFWREVHKRSGVSERDLQDYEMLEQVDREYIPSPYLDEHGWPFNWREMPVEEMSVAMIAQLEKEEFDRKMVSVRRSMRRARVKVRDYALSTGMKYFVTFTLDKEKIDRYNVAEITKCLNRWLDNQVRRKGLCYVMVPELHWDGAIHFHALINGALDTVDSGTVIPAGIDPATGERYKPKKPRNERQRTSWIASGGRIVYNLPAWPYGFTTALELDGNYERAVNYVSKYISKGLNGDPDTVPVKVGGRWYYSGGKLGTPGLEFFNANMEDLEASFGDAARRVQLEDLADVEMIVVWIDKDGVPRVRQYRKEVTDRG